MEQRKAAGEFISSVLERREIIYVYSFIDLKNHNNYLSNTQAVKEKSIKITTNWNVKFNTRHS